MDNTIETMENDTVNIKIYQDEDAQSSREWDNLGTMVCWHRNYVLGDKEHLFPKDFDLEEINRLLKELDIAVILPLYLYDHSGITMSTSNSTYPFNCPWDSGCVGFIYVTKTALRKELSKQRLSKKSLEYAKRVLLQEVETYDEYLTGQVYGYVIEDKSGEHLDSCWGFYGYNYCNQEAESAAEYQVKTLTQAGRAELAGQLSLIS